jgi:hypothetical protein
MEHDAYYSVSVNIIVGDRTLDPSNSSVVLVAVRHEDGWMDRLVGTTSTTTTLLSGCNTPNYTNEGGIAVRHEHGP